LKHYIWLLFISLLFIGCESSEEDIQVQVDTQYNIKVEELRAKKLLECKSEALRLAEVIADSLVRALQIDPLSDPLYNPEIPDRPQYIPVDTSVFDSKHSVKPIL